MQKSLLQMRIERNMTQNELAKTIGISQQAVSHWEQKVRTPKMAMIKKLAEVFEVQPAEIFECFNT